MRLVTDRPRPRPGPHDYLVRVDAAGINFADVLQSRGQYGGGPQPPYAAGFEAAGEIIAIGSDVEDALPVGTHVVGAGPGAFAELMTMPAAHALPAPAGWTGAQSLGFVLNWATALAALKPLGELQSGDTVLVHAAAGGVGQAAVRLARHYGATVVAAASPGKHQVVQALGPDVVVDATRADLAEEIRRQCGGVDLTLDSVGRRTLGASLAVTKKFTGRVVVLGAASGDATLTTDDLVFHHPVQVKGLHIGALSAAAPHLYRDVIDELRRLIAAGVYPPGNPQVHALSDGPDLLEQLAAGRTHGKLALDPYR